ncbi:MAG: type II secretion system protein GspL [Burkholderiaceae bacterium]
MEPAQGRDTQVDWVRSSDGQQVQTHGQAGLTDLPADKDVVLVLPPRALSWHRVDVPKVNQARLRAVLDGLLEDRLLDDVDEMHLAIEAGKRPGQVMWVAACRKTWLSGWLQALESAGRPAARIVPALWPLPSPPAGHPGDVALDTSPSLHWAHEEGDSHWLTSTSPAGVSSLPLQVQGHMNAQTLLAALMPTTDIDPFSAADEPQGVRWMTDPAVAADAEAALGQRFELVQRHDWLLQAALSDWNLAQFGFSLSASARQGQRWRSLFRRWRTAPAWRPARLGLLALIVAQLAGLNVAAWTERQQLEAKETQIRSLMQQSFPNVTLVLDAPAQMRREVARLQQASGTLGETDLEAQLSALGLAVPEGGSWPARIQYDKGQARFGAWPAAGTPPEQVVQALRASGWQAGWDGDAIRMQSFGGRP